MANMVTTNAPSGARRKRKGVHSKSKTSKLQSSRNYKKAYRGQGK